MYYGERPFLLHFSLISNKWGFFNYRANLPQYYDIYVCIYSQMLFDFSIALFHRRKIA